MTYNVPTRAVTRSSSLRTSVNIRSFPVRKDGNTQTAERHTSQAFVAFLTDLLTHVARKREVHIICDNRSAHKTNRVVAFLAEHPTVHLHFTPTYASCVNQAELWFSKIERDLIHLGGFTSVPNLATRVLTYIHRTNEDPRPIRWRYNDPKRRIRGA